MTGMNVGRADNVNSASLVEGKRYGCRVKYVHDHGVDVVLDNGTEGFVHFSDITCVQGKSISDVLHVGDNMEATYLGFRGGKRAFGKAAPVRRTVDRNEYHARDTKNGSGKSNVSVSTNKVNPSQNRITPTSYSVSRTRTDRVYSSRVKRGVDSDVTRYTQFGLKRLSRKLIRLLPFTLIGGGGLWFLGPLGNALSITLLVISLQISVISIIGWGVSVYERRYAYPNSNRTLSLSKNTRREMVENFNRKWSIGLTIKQINLIVLSSYTSAEWEDEIRIMGNDRTVISEWYEGRTGWLHVYMKAFADLQITSDFNRQNRIVIDAFRQIIESPLASQFDIDGCIDYINRNFTVCFDDLSFKALCSYMSDMGYIIELPESAHVRYENEINRLARKYD